MGLQYKFSQAAAAKVAAARLRLGADSDASALRELLGLGGTLARYTADDGALWFQDPGTNRYDKVPVLGRDWDEALEAGSPSDRLLVIHYESLLPQIGATSRYLDLATLESTIKAMVVIGMDASHYMDRRSVWVWNPETGSDHVVSLPAVALRKETASPSVR